nr:MAG TPA: hypothetical protein [Caudoviricetes sp.]
MVDRPGKLFRLHQLTLLRDLLTCFMVILVLLETSHIQHTISSYSN